MIVEPTASDISAVHPLHKRAWTTPLVIESTDVSETRTGGAQPPNDASSSPNVAAS